MKIQGPTSHSIISQRLKLRYADWGNADAPPLLLIHGGRDHCRSWDWVATELQQDWHIIAPDLRGHGDSEWAPDGTYTMPGFLYDLAQLIHQLDLAPVTIVAHSFGGNIALRYAGLYPDHVRKLVAIEGLGPSPEQIAKAEAVSHADRWRKWIAATRKSAGRQPRRYKTFDDALKRMQSVNGHLSDAQVRHLTIHAVSRNEDGSYSWKFDNYFRVGPPVDMPREDLTALWGAITCPTLLMYGDDSWASNPEADGRLNAFNNGARVKSFKQAGHWLHHDQFDQFMAEIRAFL